MMMCCYPGYVFVYLYGLYQIGNSSLIFERQYIGPKICGELSRRTVGCTYYIFNPTPLICKMYTGRLRKYLGPGIVVKIEKEERKFPKRDCPVASVIVWSQSRAEHCVKAKDPCRQNGYSLVSGSRFCYKVHKAMVNWTLARYSCQQEGGDLASLNTRKEYRYAHNFLDKVYPGKVYRLWIGMRRTPGTRYRWITGATRYISWQRGDPSFGNESCVLMKRAGLGDCPCYTPLHYMCEIV